MRNYDTFYQYPINSKINIKTYFKMNLNISREKFEKTYVSELNGEYNYIYKKGLFEATEQVL